MADIYKLSNRNRRRNKEKKKLRDGAAEEGPAGPPLPPAQAPAFDYFAERSKRSKGGESESAADASAADFLAQMGWTTEGAAASMGHFTELAEPQASNPYLSRERA